LGLDQDASPEFWIRQTLLVITIRIIDINRLPSFNDARAGQDGRGDTEKQT
jgi:hypothetical protein